ncbi:MAG: hypothetical protein U0836_05285 [Pirellulales bacterium]
MPKLWWRMSRSSDDLRGESPDAEPSACLPRRPACPVCGGRLVEVRAKLQCSQCHRICETCCEGDRG